MKEWAEREKGERRRERERSMRVVALNHAWYGGALLTMQVSPTAQPKETPASATHAGILWSARKQKRSRACDEEVMTRR